MQPDISDARTICNVDRESNEIVGRLFSDFAVPGPIKPAINCSVYGRVIRIMN